MSAYCIFDVKRVIDPSLMEQYRNAVGPTVDQYGGRYVAVGGEVVRVEGKPEVTFPVIIQFPSLVKAKDWYESLEYSRVKPLREKAAETTAYFVEGF